VATDWQKLRNEYLQTSLSIRRLAEKNGVSPSALQKHAAREGWAQDRRARRTEDPAAAACEADRMAQLKAIGDRLTAQLARATDELDKQIVRHKRKVREMTYDDPEASGKPVMETVEERVLLEVVDAPVDSMGLKRLSATLKILRDVTKADGDGEQAVTQVEELMRRLDAEAGKENGPECP
jgi:hypothetical protein